MSQRRLSTTGSQGQQIGDDHLAKAQIYLMQPLLPFIDGDNNNSNDNDGNSNMIVKLVKYVLAALGRGAHPLGIGPCLCGG